MSIWQQEIQRRILESLVHPGEAVRVITPGAGLTFCRVCPASLFRRRTVLLSPISESPEMGKAGECGGCGTVYYAPAQ